jgi:hypothetical protein
MISKIKNSNINQVGKSFHDDTFLIVHVALEKHKNTIRDSLIIIDLQTEGLSFPFQAI